MTPAEVTSLITTVGFPIVAAYFMWVFTKSRIESSELAAQRRETEAAVREGKLSDRLNHLEENIRTQLVAVVNEAKDVMSDCSGTIKACTATLQALKRSDHNRPASS